MGKYFFVETRAAADGGNEALRRFRPEDALNPHDRAWAALRTEVSRDGAARTVVISHIKSWLRSQYAESISGEFGRFIERDLTYYARWYERLRRASETLTRGRNACASMPITILRSSIPC